MHSITNSTAHSNPQNEESFPKMRPRWDVPNRPPTLTCYSYQFTQLLFFWFLLQYCCKYCWVVAESLWISFLCFTPHLTVVPSCVLRPSTPSMSPSVEALESSHLLPVIVGEPHPAMDESSLLKPILLSSVPQSSFGGPFPHWFFWASMRLVRSSQLPQSLPTIVASVQSFPVIYAHLDLPAMKSKFINICLTVFHNLPILWRCWPLRSSSQSPFALLRLVVWLAIASFAAHWSIFHI